MEQTYSCKREEQNECKKGKGLATERICVTHRHRQQCGDGQREWR